MPKIVEQTVYTLKELKEVNEKAYEKAYNILTEWNTDLPRDYFDSTFDYVFEKYGIKDGKICSYIADQFNTDVHYSCHLPCYLSMKAIAKECDDLDARLLFNLIELGFIEINAKVRCSNSQGPYMDVDVMVNDNRLFNSKKLEGIIDDLSKFLEEELEYLKDEIRAELEFILQKEYKYLESEECVLEFAEINEYLFTKNGEVWHG